jgi:CRP-like cAMP-binding protein
MQKLAILWLSDRLRRCNAKAAKVPKMSSSIPRVKNRLLESLPRHDRQGFLARCKHIELAAGVVLWEPEQRVRCVLFPTSGYISLIKPDTGRPLGGLVGSEGMVGLPLVLGVGVTPQKAVVQADGAFWRIGATAFRREFERSPPLRRVLNRYVYVILRQTVQIANCAHTHDLDTRLARWLLTTADRVHASEFRITQEFISSMLGVRRAGVTQAASFLKHRGLIRYKRGHLAILDRPGLQAAACECYAASKALYSKFIG